MLAIVGCDSQVFKVISGLENLEDVQWKSFVEIV